MPHTATTPKPRAPLALQRAAGQCALCAVGYWLARLLCGGLVGLLQRWWLHGPGVGAPPQVWQALQWGGSLLGGTVALLAPVALAPVLCKELAPRYAALLRLRRGKGGVLQAALPLYLGGAQLCGLLAGAVGSASGSAQQVVLPDTLPALVLAFLALCVVPAVLEELLFRGLAQGLVRPCGALAAVTAQAVLFALLHGSLSGVVYALPAGLFFGLLAEQTGSILPGMLLHLCNNLLSFVQVLLVGAGYGSLAALLGGICLVVFPLWAVVTLLILRRRKTLRWRPLRPGASPAALLDCREWRFTVLVLLAASVLEAVAL